MNIKKMSSIWSAKPLSKLRRLTKILFPSLLLTLPYAAQAQFTYSTNAGAITLTGYNGSGGVVIISNFVSSIGQEAFYNCTSLASVTIPDSVNDIDSDAFAYCLNLTNLVIGDSVTNIGVDAFLNCANLTSVAIPNSVTSIGGWAFQDCASLTNVTIPNSVTSIGNFAFQYCGSLAGVTIGNRVTSIGEMAFWACNSLTNVTIPNNVTNIEDAAFASCTGLTAINVAANNPSYTSLAGVLFDKSQATLIQFPGNGPTTYAIPDGVTSIGYCAFFKCTNLTSVTIPDSVTNIGGNAFDICTHLADAPIPNSVTSIGAGAFEDCFALTSVTIPNSVTNIGEIAFYDCFGLTTVTIGNSVTSIGSQAFAYCAKLSSAYFQGNAPSVADSLTFLEDPVTVYCYQGATGWGTTLGGAPVVVLGPLPPAPAITAQPRNVLAHAYDTVSFGVTATGTQPLYYQWTFNGTNIAGATSSALTIANVVDTNLGVYAVVVTNSYGAATSSNAVLSMYPFLAVPFAGLDTNWGSTNTLSVEAWGTGPLSYQWFDNGVPINNVTNPSLTLSSIQFSNAGLYSVVVSSPCGSVTNTPQQVVVNPAGVLLGTYPGVTIMGVAGYNYIVQRTANLADTNSWVTVANVALAQPVQVWVDTNINLSAPGNPQQFYTVLLAP